MRALTGTERRVDAGELARRVERIEPQVIQVRRQLHRQPELSGQEAATAAFVRQMLEEAGIAVAGDIGGHGLVARIESTPSRPWVALRADMDALPIADGKACDYASGVAGVCHACGHDAHTAMLVGAALVLHELRRQLPVNVMCIFQPAEETAEGARAMLEAGLFRDVAPQRIHALHVYPYLPSGSIGLRAGVTCAAADMFEVELRGRGGHAARPHECVDVIFIASHIIQALHHIVSRRVNPLHPAVLTIGQIQGGAAPNVIPDHVRFAGTVRSLNPEAHEEMRTRMDRIIRQTAETWGAVAAFHMKQAIPMLANDADVLNLARDRLTHYLPQAPLIDMNEPSMGGEDFAEFLRQVPGALLRLGTGGDPASRYPLHHPCFDIDEQALAVGVATLAALCLDEAPA